MNTAPSQKKRKELTKEETISELNTEQTFPSEKVSIFYSVNSLQFKK